MDLGRTSPVAELRTGPALPLPAVAARTTAAAASTEPAARTAESTTTAGTASARTTAARETAGAALAVEIATGTALTTRPTHPVHHGEVRLRVLRQALAKAARYLKGFAAVLSVGCGRR